MSAIELNTNLAKKLFRKQAGLIINDNKIETLVLGSSHGDYGFRSDLYENSYNLGLTSSDLYFNYQFYKLLFPKLPNLKNLILFYSVFSPGHELEKTKEYHIAILFKLIFGIPYRDSNLKIYEEKIIEALGLIPEEEMPDNYTGYEIPDWFFDEAFGVENRAKMHLRENSRSSNQTKYVEKISSLAKKHKHKLTVVLSPAREDYKSFLPDSSELFKELNNLKGIDILNYYDDKDFTRDDFGDFDHLNQDGAKKLTQKIYKALHT